jgi:hypothetical protein
MAGLPCGFALLPFADEAGESLGDGVVVGEIRGEELAEPEGGHGQTPSNTGADPAGRLAGGVAVPIGLESPSGEGA